MKTLGDGFIREVLKSSRGRVNDLANKSSTKRFLYLSVQTLDGRDFLVKMFTAIGSASAEADILGDSNLNLKSYLYKTFDAC